MEAPVGLGDEGHSVEPQRRLRVRDYRVIYTVDNGELVVWVVHVGHRSTVYGT